MLRKLLIPVVIVAVLGGAAGVAYASHNGGDHSLDKVRHATKQFRSLSVAVAAEYGELLDKDGIACIDMPDMGAMGVHYVNGSLVGDGAVDALTPEAVVYEPDERGRMRLVALEYVVFKDAWTQTTDRSRRCSANRSTRLSKGTGSDCLPSIRCTSGCTSTTRRACLRMWNPKVTCTPDDGHDGHGHGGEGDHVGQMDG